MHKLGFHERWIQLVMWFVLPITYVIRVNGVPCGAIRPTRGLRQGDPLSPYFFILVAEGLSALIHKAIQTRTLKWLAASVRGSKVSHLFFVDDSLIFNCPTIKERWEIQRILQVYEASLGQQLNWSKTSLFFSWNLDNATKESIKTMFGAQLIKPHESYLGLLSLVGRSKKNSFT